MNSTTGFLLAVTVFTALILGTSTTPVESSPNDSRKNLVDEFVKEFVGNSITNCREGLDICERSAKDALSKASGDEAVTIAQIISWFGELYGRVDEQEEGLMAAVQDGTPEVLKQTVMEMNAAKVQTGNELTEKIAIMKASPGQHVKAVIPVTNASVLMCMAYADNVGVMFLDVVQGADRCKPCSE